MEDGRKEYRVERVDTSAWLHRVADEFQRTPAAQGKTIAVSVPDGLPPLMVDAQAMGGAIHNLLDNAVKYSPGCDTVWLDGSATSDGAWIVSRIPEDDAEFSIMAARGGPLRTLMPATPSDELVAWSADGAHVLFLSREGASNDLMAVRVIDGQAADRPFLIRTLPSFVSLGVSHSGALFYQSTQEARLNVYRASFDMASGRVGTASRVDVSTGYLNGSASWSPDGRRLAYVSWPQDKPARTLSIWSLENAQTRSFSLAFNAWRWSWHPTTWSADGRWVYVVGTDDAGLGTLQRVNSESGMVEAVVPPESGIFVMKDPKALSYPFGWSSDARMIYKSDLHLLKGTGLADGAISVIAEHRLADRAERELLRLGPSSAKLVGTSVSPDGSQLVFCVVDYAARKLTVMVMPAAGGPARAVAELPGTDEGVARWTRDSRAIVFASRGDMPGGGSMCDLATGVVKTLTLASDMVEDIAVSPSGKEIAYVGGNNPDQGVWVLENLLPKPSTGAPKKEAKRRACPVGSAHRGHPALALADEQPRPRTQETPRVV